MFSVLVIRLRSLRLLRVSGIVMRLRMFLLLITFLKASHSFRNRLLVICKNAYLFATMIMTPLPPETELSRQMTTSTTSIDIMGLQAAYANLHTDQERDYFMQRYHDVISSFGGKTSYDADNRPLLVMRSNLWASGYDVDGT